MIRSADNPAAPGLGLYLDSIGLRAGTSTDGHKSLCIASEQYPIPPAALLPRLSGEHIAADIGCIPDIRGSGHYLPEDALVDPNKVDSARFPIAFAWKKIIERDTVDWGWLTPEGVKNKCTAYEAIAIVAQCAISDFGYKEDQQVAMIVPNSIDETIQESLLKELRLSCPSPPKLLWRPIASALAWCEEHASQILDTNPEPNHSVGDLLCLHLGFDGFEHCILKLIPRRHGSEMFLLPARSLPKSDTTITPNIDVLDQLTECVIGSIPEQQGFRWWTQWCTNFLARSFAQYEVAAGRPLEPNCITCPTKEDIENIISSSKSTLQIHKRWVEKLASLNVSNVLGVVATGQLASVQMGSHTFAGRILLQAGINPSSVKLYSEGVHARFGELLPRGAAIFAKRVSLGLPSYLDTIPRIETIVTKEGEPTWAELIPSIDEYVLGGELWKHSSKPSELPLQINRGEQHLKLTVWREGHDLVREVVRDWPQPTKEKTAVELEVRMFPGQGNPRVEVKPRQRGVLGFKRVYLDWSRSEEKPYGKQEALDNEERTNPPLEKRKASLDCWQETLGSYQQRTPAFRRDQAWKNACDCTQQLMGLYRRGRMSRIPEALVELRNSLRQRDETYIRKTPAEHASAVSSDGHLHELANDKELLPMLVTKLIEIISSNHDSSIRDNAFRCLGNCSSDDPDVRNIIHKFVSRKRRPTAAELWLIGGCLRNPADIGEFAKRFVDWLETLNNPLRALARILQYREDATSKIPSAIAIEITDNCCWIARQELDLVLSGDQTKLAQIYRHASLCIVFMLRRRKYDPAFLPPDEPLALEAKALFARVLSGIDAEECKNLIRSELRYLTLFAQALCEMSPEECREATNNESKCKSLLKKVAAKLDTAEQIAAMGGFVDPVHVTKLMIDYIDKRGRGRLGVPTD
ncbi:MAG: hypothetical protein IH984_11920 [Planctomycetes bacterium]|nr:hypothetical protein [Planctomycetota bacterium]